MHQRLQEIVDFLGDARAEVLQAVDANPPDPADPERWSVADNLEHLRIVETGVSRLIHVTISRHPGPMPLEDQTTSMLHSIDHCRLLDRGRRKLAAPALVQPLRNRPRPEALSDLLASRARLVQTLGECNGVALGQFNYPHLTLGTLDLYQWLVFVGQHERRHAAQIRELQ